MKKVIGFILITLSTFILVACSNKSEQRVTGTEIVDDLGNKFTFAQKPERIISLAPSLTEMIYSLELQNRLVGNTLYCNYPEAAARVEKVGDLLTFNFEKIVTLKPDLIFITVEGNTKETYDKFRELGLKIFVSNPRNYNGIKKTCSDMGKIFGIEQRTKDTIAGWDSVINSISLASQKNKILTGAIIVEINPIMIAGKSTYFNEFFDICGLKNIAEDSPLNYPIFSREELLNRNPDFIFYTTFIGDKLERVITSYPEWKNLKAVKNKNFCLIDRDLFSRPGPRFANAVKYLYKLIHH